MKILWGKVCFLCLKRRLQDSEEEKEEEGRRGEEKKRIHKKRIHKKKKNIILNDEDEN